MNTTNILHNVTLGDVRVSTAIAYQGGATWEQVTDTTSDTGFTAVEARVGDVGVGGFSSGGGIGFLAGAYGYAVDRLRALEVVLLSGKIVLATKTNEYSDLFRAIQGGGGQLGIVTTFYQDAVSEPTSSEFGIWIVARDSWERARHNTVEFFDSNTDPFSLMYYSLGYYSEHITTGNLTTTMVIVGIRFADPRSQSASTRDAYEDVKSSSARSSGQSREQMSFNATFSKLLHGLNLTQASIQNVPYGQAIELSAPFFPYGYRRGFCDVLNKITHDHQASMGPFVADYPNYISPKTDGHRVWGDNVERLIKIKTK
jgi:hypothetical protein